MRRTTTRYLPSDNPKHTLDVFAPHTANAPFVHFIHGGYWVSGDKDGGGHGDGLYASLGNALARAGIGCVIQSYRLAPETNIEGMLSDVRAAIDWTIQNARHHHGDASRVFVMGHSAGGHLTALLAADEKLRPPDVRGYVALSAVWDLQDMHDLHDEGFNRNVTYPTFGRKREALRRYSPMTHLSAHTPPVLVVVGANDFPYMIPQAKRAAAKLQREVAVLEGYSHMAMVKSFGGDDDRLTPLIAKFVRR